MTPRLATIPLAIGSLRFCAPGQGTPGLEKYGNCGRPGVDRRVTENYERRALKPSLRYGLAIHGEAQIDGAN
jgi:hypothetical protein